MFLRVALKIASGRGSYSVAKPLKGTKKHVILEAKLDSGQRILWTKVIPQEKDYEYTEKDADNKEISVKIDDDEKMKPRLFIWCVSKHDDVSKNMSNIVRAFTRLGISEQSEFSRHLIQTQVLVELTGNACMKVYSNSFTQIDEERANGKQPKFSMRLTREEKEITKKTGGSVMVFGRSGTGKTICLTDKMRCDRQLNSTISQLFVARNLSLKNLVKSYQQNTDSSFASYEDKFTFYTFKEFLVNMYSRVENHLKKNGIAAKVFNDEKRVSAGKFKEEIWPKIKSGSTTIFPITLWTQIHTCLKGSVEVIMKEQVDEKNNAVFIPIFNHLKEEEYLDEVVFPFERCKLNLSQRGDVYELFKRYQDYLHKNDLWDDSDKTLYILENSHLQDVLDENPKINFNFTETVNEENLHFTMIRFILTKFKILLKQRQLYFF